MLLESGYVVVNGVIEKKQVVGGMKLLSAGLVVFLLGLVLMVAGCAQGGAGLGGGMIPDSKTAESVSISDEGDQFYVQASALNMRECPGSSCRILKVLTRDQPVTVLERKAGWAQVKPEGDADTGWVAARFLAATKNAEANSSTKSGNGQEPPTLQEEYAETLD